MKRLLMGYIGICLAAYLVGCAPKEIVRTDLASIRENSEAFADKRVILQTDIVELMHNPTPYDSMEIEVSGIVGQDSTGIDWGFYLEDTSGARVKCYEYEYRYSPLVMVDAVVNRARDSHEKMTVTGFFKKGFGIELNWIEYQGQTYYTNYKPDLLGLPAYWP